MINKVIVKNGVSLENCSVLKVSDMSLNFTVPVIAVSFIKEQDSGPNFRTIEYKDLTCYTFGSIEKILENSVLMDLYSCSLLGKLVHSIYQKVDFEAPMKSCEELLKTMCVRMEKMYIEDSKIYCTLESIGAMKDIVNEQLLKYGTDSCGAILRIYVSEESSRITAEGIACVDLVVNKNDNVY